MKSYLIILVLALLSCCKTEETNRLECSDLKSGFIDSNYSLIKPIFDAICQKYVPIPTNSDPLGHRNNTDLILNELHEKCIDIKIEMVCYACAESIPLQSIFRIKLDSNNVQIERQFNLFVPEGKVMYFNN